MAKVVATNRRAFSRNDNCHSYFLFFLSFFVLICHTDKLFNKLLVNYHVAINIIPEKLCSEAQPMSGFSLSYKLLFKLRVRAAQTWESILFCDLAMIVCWTNSSALATRKMLYVASVCTPCCMFIQVVAQSLKPVKLSSQQLATFLSFHNHRSVAS